MPPRGFFFVLALSIAARSAAQDVLGSHNEGWPTLASVCADRLFNNSMKIADLVRGTTLRIAGPDYLHYCTFPPGTEVHQPVSSNRTDHCAGFDTLLVHELQHILGFEYTIEKAPSKTGNESWDWDEQTLLTNEASNVDVRAQSADRTVGLACHQ